MLRARRANLPNRAFADNFAQAPDSPNPGSGRLNSPDPKSRM
jgi:hypothetical protein